ncbi:Protein AIM2 [Madurella mycetomatis]|uniref:Protein AIM2 n=1 Tax=Madurella mycetomatis TaxID=100816 RepID=A0A175VR94_9PEZI|nr:Protein AIM2 [Madurella mycetomatis]
MQAPMCRDCFTGTLRGDVVPSGAEEAVHGIPTYVARPDPGVQPLGIVVIATDAFGWKLRNTRALADTYARRVPCIVYVPDFFNGHGIPENGMLLLEDEPQSTDNFLARLLKKAWTTLRIVPIFLRFAWFNRRGVTEPRAMDFMRAVRAAPGPPTGEAPPKVGVAGFCWGGRPAVLWLHDEPQNKVLVGGREYPLIDCAFTAHPSLLKIPEYIDKVVQPLSVANGEDDEWMGREKMKKLVSTLEAKNATAGQEVHEVVVYGDAKHGFAVRGDRNDLKQRERGDQSEDQAVKWFKKHFEE